MEDGDVQELREEIERLKKRLAGVEERSRPWRRRLWAWVPSSGHVRVAVWLAVLLGAAAAYAATVSVPYTFTNGTIADAEKVNANFAVLVTDAQDPRLAALEAALASVQSDLAAKAVAIESNAASISANTSSITANAASISSNAAQIAVNDADIGANSAAIATNSTAVGTLNSQYGTRQAASRRAEEERDSLVDDHQPWIPERAGPVTKDGVQIGITIEGEVLEVLGKFAEADRVDVQEYIQRLLGRHVSRRR